MLKTCLFQCFHLHKNQIAKTHEIRPIWDNDFNISKSVVLRAFGVLKYQNVKMPGKDQHITL